MDKPLETDKSMLLVKVIGSGKMVSTTIADNHLVVDGLRCQAQEAMNESDS